MPGESSRLSSLLSVVSKEDDESKKESKIQSKGKRQLLPLQSQRSWERLRATYFLKSISKLLI